MHARHTIMIGAWKQVMCEAGARIPDRCVERLLRTTFRSLHNDWPETLDVIVIVHPHDPASIDSYRSWMDEAVQKAMRASRDSA